MAEGKKRRREEPGVRRAQILAAAKRSFMAHGLQATTVDQIALEAKVSVGLLYRFFTSGAGSRLAVPPAAAADLKTEGHSATLP